MRFISLTSNKPSFHPVHFKPGLNIILGKKSNPDNKDLQKTFNGVGKSLMIQIIHFCLASNKIDDFSTKLPGWEFALEFELNGTKYISKRSTDNQAKIILNEKECSVEEVRNILGKEAFGLEEAINYVTFKSLISHFIRPSKSSYITFDKMFEKEKEYQKLVNNAYLLGLDIQRASRKYNLKIEMDKALDLKKNIENDEIFHRYFTGKGDAEIEIIDLKEKIKRLDTALEKFKVANDYSAIKKNVHELRQHLQENLNKIELLTSDVHYIDLSLSKKIDVPKDSLLKMYTEAKITIPEMVKKRLDEVLIFHESIIKNRFKRLNSEKTQLMKQIKELDVKHKELGVQLDENMDYLGKHGELEEFLGLTRQLAIYKAKLEKLNTYKGLLAEYRKKISEYKIEFGKEDLDTSQYISTIEESIIAKNISIFRSLSKEFYTDRPGGIEILNNEGLNQSRYNINVKLEDDASDGINEVKIFCYDLTLLLAQHNHVMQSVVHDGRLFSNMDPRQHPTLFREAYKHTSGNYFQYIATVNENVILPFKEIYTEDEYKQIIDDNIILELTDESAESKLLGIQVDLDYEKD